MNESEFRIRTLEHLINGYIALNKLHAEPGLKAHMLAYSIRFLERLIRQAVK